ncbi:MAG: hypothetical protein H6739_04810 [Alphaproteobacteria bacterium]|nr:hypothetical protein [Alphaproteobacteria bacterium]
MLSETSRLEVRLAVCDRLRKIDSQGTDAMKAAPILFGLVQPAMVEGVLLALARLYDRNGDRSVWKLLKVAQGTIKQIPWSKPPTHADLTRQLGALAHHESTLDTLRTLRDKSIAHVDKEYADDPSTFSSVNSIPVQDLISLLRATQGLLAEHCSWFGAPWPISMAGVVEVGTQQMVDGLLDIHRSGVERRAKDCLPEP